MRAGFQRNAHAADAVLRRRNRKRDVADVRRRDVERRAARRTARSRRPPPSRPTGLSASAVIRSGLAGRPSVKVVQHRLGGKQQDRRQKQQAERDARRRLSVLAPKRRIIFPFYPFYTLSVSIIIQSAPLVNAVRPGTSRTAAKAGRNALPQEASNKS